MWLVHSCSLVPRLPGTVLGTRLHSCMFTILNSTCLTLHTVNTALTLFAQSCGYSVSTMDNASVSTSQFVSHFSRERSLIRSCVCLMLVANATLLAICIIKTWKCYLITLSYPFTHLVWWLQEASTVNFYTANMTPWNLQLCFVMSGASVNGRCNYTCSAYRPTSLFCTDAAYHSRMCVV